MLRFQTLLCLIALPFFGLADGWSLEPELPFAIEPHTPSTMQFTDALTFPYANVPKNHSKKNQTTQFTTLYLSLFRPAEPTTQAVPVLICFHGRHSSPERFVSFCRMAVQAGIAAVAVAYRLPENDDAETQESLEDVRNALHWLRSNASAFQLDPHKMIGVGSSYGGFAVLGATLFAAQHAENDSLSFNAMFLMCPALRKRDGIALEKLVRPALPPVAILHGTADDKAQFKLAERFSTQMARKGNICRLLAFERETHGFWLHPQHREKVQHELFAFLSHIGFYPATEQSPALSLKAELQE